MRKISLLIALCLSLGIAQTGAAIQRKHRPWLSSSSKEVVQNLLLPSREKVGMRDGVDVSTAKNHPSPSSSPLKGEEITKQALQYKGTRYKYGGTSKRAVDCSGLVTRVWEDLKMKKIPRASSALYNSGKAVHLAELRPGDLVFFKNTFKRGISHVGVYTGNNKFVHAAGHAKGVTITKLSDPYYQLHYAGARRLY